MMTTTLNLGYIPLTDAAPLLVAAELGYFEQAGLDVRLHREHAWSTLRDKTELGLLDASHMLAPMAGPAGNTRFTPMATLSMGGNGITVAAHHGPPERPTFAVPFPQSNHHAELLRWLEREAIHNAAVIVLAPPDMPEALRRGEIDGMCVGEPWNTAAEASGWGRVVASGRALYPRGARPYPEKVLGTTPAWLTAHPEAAAALGAALASAADWLADHTHAPAAADLLAAPQHLDVPASLLLPALTGARADLRWR